MLGFVQIPLSKKIKTVKSALVAVTLTIVAGETYEHGDTILSS